MKNVTDELFGHTGSPGLRIKIFLALFPSAVHLDTPSGSRSFARRNRAWQLYRAELSCWNGNYPDTIIDVLNRPPYQNEHYACHT
jgi:hypothetical protein